MTPLYVNGNRVNRNFRLIAILMAFTAIAVLGGVVSPSAASASTNKDAISGSISTDEAQNIADDIDLASHQKSTETLDRNSIKGYKLKDGNYFVGYNFTGDDLVSVSSLSAVVTPEGEIVSTGEMVLKELTKSSGDVKSWVNGNLSVDEVVTDEDASKADIQAKGFWQKLDDCLSSQGLSGWTATAIATACAAACVATAGAGCAICIAGLTGFGSGVVTYCIGKANGK